MYARTEDRDKATTWATREARYDAVCTRGIPDHGLPQRPGAINMPVLAANGDSDPMILPRHSHLLADLIPRAKVIIYPDSAHGLKGLGVQLLSAACFTRLHSSSTS